MNLSDKILQQIKVARAVTNSALRRGQTVDRFVCGTISELGEFADAYRSEIGEKPRDLKEDTRWEAGDVIICALSLFFARGGTPELLAEIFEKKIAKWDANVAKLPLKPEGQ